jgi:hypothetical protein
MTAQDSSIFKKYFSEQPFVDRFASNPDGAIDVIIPIIHTNELWHVNLLSLYREIPIARLLIGDGGCIDDSVDVARKFPRVEVLDHRKFISLGYSLRHLIEAVRTEWFIYVHSDVYLPPGWFDTMRKHQGSYDWFGCPQQVTVMVEYPYIEQFRPYAGSQMGRKVAFSQGLSSIDDDYVYRQEDFVLADIVAKAGFKEGKVEDVFHYHQVTYRPSAWGRKVKRVDVSVELSVDEEVRSCMTQAKGIVKYLDPDPVKAGWIVLNVDRLTVLQRLSWREFRQWVSETKPAWLPYLPKAGRRERLRLWLTGLLHRLLK